MSASRRLATALLVLAAAAPALGQRVDLAEASTLALQSALLFTPSGIQHPRIVALRALHDPAMKPLFQALLKAEQPAMRLDGLLGLAEASGEAGADAEVIRAVGDPALRTVAIQQCLGLSLLKPVAIRSILAWSDLPAYDRTLLVAELNRRHEAWEPALLQDAPQSAMAETKSLAAMLQLERGDDSTWREVLEKLPKVSAEDRADLLRRLADAALHYELKASAKPLLDATADSRGSERLAALAAAATLQPALGRQAMLAHLNADRSPANALQCGMVMLAASEAFEPADFAQLKGLGTTADAIAEAGQAKRTPGADARAPLLALVQSGNRPVAEWALQELAKLPPDARREPLLKVIDRLETLEQPTMHDRLLAVLAAQKLMASDADELARRITAQGGRPEIADSIATAMSDLGTPEAAAFARMVRGKLTQQGESMALVAIARANAGMNPGELRELGRIGGGGGRVDEPVQMQAAWLYLKQANRLDQAMPRLVTP